MPQRQPNMEAPLIAALLLAALGFIAMTVALVVAPPEDAATHLAGATISLGIMIGGTSHLRSLRQTRRNRERAAIDRQARNRPPSHHTPMGPLGPGPARKQAP